MTYLLGKSEYLHTIYLNLASGWHILYLMTLQEIYDLAIEMGMAADPRGKVAVKKLLAKRKKDYTDLPEKKKKFFDKENFTNPYSDSRILFGDPKISVKKLMAGIDAEEAEVLLLDRLNQKGLPAGRQDKIDLLVSHHPVGHARASLDEVMDVQVDMFANAGVPENVAYSLFEARKGVVRRRIGPSNHGRAIDAAKLLDVPLLALHTIWDNMGYKFMKDYLGNKKFDTLGELLDYILEIPEFQESTKGKAGPAITAGSPGSRVGKITVGFTGGTNASKELYVELAKAGVGTIVEMHVGEEVVEELKKLHINIIDVGHMAADSIGANLFLDALEKRGVEVIPCSGLIRVKRGRKNGT